MLNVTHATSQLRSLKPEVLVAYSRVGGARVVELAAGWVGSSVG